MSECIEWDGARSSGYGVFNDKATRKNIYAHRRAYAIAYGPIPDGMFVRHKCDNPPCVNPDHLELGTHADNMRDMVARGRSRTGERHHAARLTAADVREIRASPESNADIAERFGITRIYAWQVRARRTWRHV